MVKRIALVVASLLMTSASVLAQEPPPAVPGVTGTIGLDGTMDTFYSATHEMVVKTEDGIRHLLHLSPRTVVHGSTPTADRPLGELEKGSHVVVQYVVDGDQKTAIEIDRVGHDGLKAVEGTVRSVDRSAKRLTVQIADGSVLTLRLTDHAARHVGKDVGSESRVIVYYADESGEWIAHYFKRATGAGSPQEDLSNVLISVSRQENRDNGRCTEPRRLIGSRVIEKSRERSGFVPHAAVFAPAGSLGAVCLPLVTRSHSTHEARSETGGQPAIKMSQLRKSSHADEQSEAAPAARDESSLGAMSDSEGAIDAPREPLSRRCPFIDL